MSIADIDQKVKGGVFSISGTDGISTWIGSGFLINRQHIVTCDHVCYKSTGSLYVYIDIPGFKITKVSVLGRDRASDIAVLELPSPIPDTIPVTILEWEDKPIRWGDQCVLVGSPMGDVQSVNSAIIRDTKYFGSSILARENSVPTQSILFDGSCIGGNSGGPLFSMDGKVIGMNYLGYDLNYIKGFMNCAVSLDILKPVVEYIINERKDYSYGYLGIQLSPIFIDGALQAGLDKIIGYFIWMVINNSPAHSAGIRSGDVITAVTFNNKKYDVGQMDSQECIFRFVHLNAGKQIILHIRRSGKDIAIPVTLSSRTDYIVRASNAGEI